MLINQKVFELLKVLITFLFDLLKVSCTFAQKN